MSVLMHVHQLQNDGDAGDAHVWRRIPTYGAGYPRMAPDASARGDGAEFDTPDVTRALRGHDARGDFNRRLLVFRRVEARPCARVKAVVASAMDWIRALLTRFDQPRGKAMTFSRTTGQEIRNNIRLTSVRIHSMIF